MGASAYCDDLALLAPNRYVLQQMVKICQEYGVEHNLVFSTDPNPARSKTKCLLFCGPKKRVKYPDPVFLDGKQLPWVERADHLGHVLHQTLSMESDSRRARGSFMTRASDIRDNLYFSEPIQKMRSINLNCCDAYGAMLWDLQSVYSKSFFRAWNIQARLAFDVPRETHTYLVHDLLCRDLPSLELQVLSRYPMFLKKLEASPSREIRFMFEIVKDDPGSATFRNIRYFKTVCKEKDVLEFSSWRARQILPKTIIPDSELWRTGLLTTLLTIKRNRLYSQYRMTVDQTRAMIYSLCAS